MAFFKKKTEDTVIPVYGKPEFIIAGLGNPGREYEYSRHNAGFLCIDVMCNEYGFRTDRVRFRALTGLASVGGKTCLVMRPQTYMNSSGEAIREAADFYKIPPENILVIFDDISLPCGNLRIRRKGSAGGHNGIKSIISELGSDNFPRIKIGIGAKPDEDTDLKDYVLGRFSKEDLETLKKRMTDAVKAAELIVSGNTDEAMCKYN